MKSSASYISSATIVQLGYSLVISSNVSISEEVRTFPVGLFGFMSTKRRTLSSILALMSSMSIRQPSFGSVDIR